MQDHGCPRGSYRDDIGIWVKAGTPLGIARTPALFLDRDGVLVEETNYLSRAEDVVLIDGAGEVVAEANRAGVPVVVVSNQAGIGRGFYGWEAFEEVDDAIRQKLAHWNASVDAVLACPFHPEGACRWKAGEQARKPNPGMLLEAARLLNLDLARSWIVGDTVSDIQAGQNAGLFGALHVLTGHGRRDREIVISSRQERTEVRFGVSIRDARPLIDLLSVDAQKKNCQRFEGKSGSGHAAAADFNSTLPPGGR